MILPDKYEDLKGSMIVLGYRVLKLLNKNDLHIYDLYKKVNKEFNIDILYFFDILTFLWLLDAIEINFNIVRYNNDIKSNIH